jgi:hypothetical protein
MLLKQHIVHWVDIRFVETVEIRISEEKKNVRKTSQREARVMTSLWHALHRDVFRVFSK